LVGAVFCTARGEALTAESLIMSCRALGRGVEHRLVAYLGDQAATRSLKYIEIPYAPTPKNQPVLRFLQSLEAEVDGQSDGARIFRMMAERAAQLKFVPVEHAESLVDTDEVETAPARAAPSTRQRRIESEGWQEIAQELSSIESILRAIDGMRRRTRPGVRTEFVVPTSDMEHTLAGLWADALGLDRVGIHDDFFELGGTSLQATLLTNTLQQTLQRGLDGGLIFEAPTVAMLVERLGAAREIGLEIVPVRRQGFAKHTAPASFSQRRLWFLDQFDPGHPVYNERRGIRLCGPLDVQALGQAVAELYARHESLRTTFATVDGQPVQIVGDQAFPGLERHDLGPLPGERAESEADRYLGEQAARSFDLTRGPLFRAGLLRLGDEDHVLWLVFHHIVADGTSMQTILRDLSVLYRAALAGTPALLPKLPVQYADFAHWQRDFLAGRSLDEQREYWIERLSGSLPVLELPLDRPRPPVLTYRGARIPFSVSPSVTAALVNLSQREGATLFMALMAAFQAMLHRYTEQDDLAVGFPIANRQRRELDGVVGFFVNTLVLRVDLSGEPTFLELLRRVRERALEAYAHQDMPFELLVDAVAPERHLDRTPLFQAMLALLDDPMECLQLSGLSVRWADIPVGTSRFDLLLNLEHGADGLAGGLEYNSDIFDRETVLRMAEQLNVLLEGIVDEPSRKLHELPLMTEAERRRLLVDWRGGSADFCADDRCLHERFEARVERSPEAVAARYEGVSLTYRELNERANQVANYLKARGVGPDVLVGLAMERSLDLVVGLLGILKAGGAYVPLDPTYPADRLSFLIEDAGIKLLVTQERCLKALPAVRSESICLDRDWSRISSAGKTNPARSAKPEHLAYVIYTSGSTGKPKGVLITHRNVTRLFDATDAWYRFDERDVWTLFHSYAFDFSVWELWGALLYGGSVVVVPYWVSRSPEAFRDLLVEERVTVLNQTPSAFRQLVRADLAQPAALYRLRYVIFGGEALELQSLRPWFERYGDELPLLVNMYGITETTVHVSYRPVRMRDLEQGTGSVIGIPIPDLRIYVLDAHGTPVPIGVPGEMYVGGAGVARGYLNRPDLTEQRFVRDPLDRDRDLRLYRSGDLARWKSDGDLEYLGRIDHQVKIRGFRIELGEIEAALGEHPSVRDSVVIAQDGQGDRRLVAYVATDAEPAALIDELRARLKARLPEYMVPSAFVSLPVLPLTAHGKVDRKALPEPDFSRVRRDTVVEPRTEVERTLAEIWGSVLGVDQIGVDDNFFELGGDSILSIQVITRAREAGLAVTPKQLFQNPTIASLAVLASGQQVKTHAEQGTLTGPVPLGPIQRWFLAQNFPEPHHWNQSFVFEATRRLDRAHVEGAVRALLGQHDALRLKFMRAAREWRQEYAPESGAVQVVFHDFSKVVDAELASAIEHALGELQASLALERGELIRVACLECGAGRSPRLAFIVHHLAVDGVSWRILLEDFERAYLRLERGEPAALGPKTTSYRRWAERTIEFAGSAAVDSERDYWMSVPAAPVARVPLDSAEGGPNSEASSDMVATRLGPEQTRALLQQVPRAYGTQINDALLAALAGAGAAWTGGDRILVDLEGHGREDIGEDVDLSRTVGWFTAVFPVELELPREASLADSIRSVKEKLRGVPRKGLGYGALRHLRADAGLAARPRAEIVFNYLGQFDQVIAGSALLRFAREASGSWHSPHGTRTHAIEVLALVVDGELEIRWIYSRNLHRRATVEQLAAAYVRRLTDNVEHCASLKARSYTPSDFPLARVDQPTLDALAAGRGEIEDVYPLSPMQLLFYSMDASDSRLGSEQWHFLLSGPLDASALQRAWQRVILRHPILRTAFVSEGLRVPLQIVHRVAAQPWAEQDWRGATPAEQEARLQAFLNADRELAFDLAAAPLSRVTLLRVADDACHMVWSTHHLHVDGWSWPLIFGDLGRYYEVERQCGAAPTEPTCGYRRYIEWLDGRTGEQSEPFWRRMLRGLTSPTPLEFAKDSGGAPPASDPFVEESARLSSEDTARLQAFCREHQLTLNTLVQAAWAMLLGHVGGRDDVVFGAAFSGRPAEIPGIESMVGPCVNNVPIRISLRGGEPFLEWLSEVQRTQFEISEHQYVPLHKIQDWSEVPPRYRLFDSLLVFQNYVADEATRRLGPTLSVHPLSSPDATNYPLTLVVNPGPELRLKLIHHRNRFDGSTIASLLRELCALLAHCTRGAGERVADVMSSLSPQTKGIAVRRQRAARAAQSETGAPASDMERKVAAVWKDLFQVDSVSFDDNFFDLGGHSLLLIRAHQRLRESVRPDLSIVAMLQYPTVRTLARHLSGGEKDSTAFDAVRERARRQRGAFAQRRGPASLK
jgi:amino acid adenylation domain-containing protein/non-ribosomal peptide synthase protein (TIGR01720 family)